MYFEPPTPQQVRDIYAEFGATEESIKNDVRHLIGWLEKRPHLPNVKDENQLINFLLLSKNSLAAAKAQIEAFYICKTVMAVVFTNHDPAQPWFRNTLNTALMLPLPKLTPERLRIGIFRIFEHESVDVPDEDSFLRSHVMMMNLWLKEEKNSGLILIYDYKNVSTALLAHIFTNSKRFLTITLKILKLRPQKIILLHVHAVVESFIVVYKRLLKKKLADRIMIWNKEAADLTQILPKETLPSDYGGSLPSSEELRNQWYDYVCKSRIWLLSEELVKADLTKKPKDIQINLDVDSHNGIDGSFRLLSID